MKMMIAGIAAAAVVFAYAQEEDIFNEVEDADTADETAAEESDAEDGNAAEVAAPGKKTADDGKTYFILPVAKLVEGTCEVLIPTKSGWQPIEEGRFYPLGSAYRTIGADSQLKVGLGASVEVSVKGDASFNTVAQKLDVTTRTIELKSGTILVNLPRNLPDGMFFVSAPGFTVVNAAGESSYAYETTGDGDKCFVKCLTGNLSVKGRHFDIIGLRASQGFVIRTSSDRLFTALYGKAGDLNVKLDTGLWQTMDFDTKEMTTEQRFAEFKLSPKTAVRIHRAVPAVGENLSVTTMTFDSNGERKDRYWFAENHYETTDSETVVEEDDSAALAKKAAEATDTEAVETEIDDSDAGSDDSDDSGDDDIAAISTSSGDDDLDF